MQSLLKQSRPFCLLRVILFYIIIVEIYQHIQIYMLQFVIEQRSIEQIMSTEIADYHFICSIMPSVNRYINLDISNL